MQPRRRFTHAHRQRLERAAEIYLRDCYRKRTAARASEFASFMGLTQPYLSRIVPEIMGMPVRDFLRARQLAYAAELLRSTPLPVHQIALASAFGTKSTFHRCFVLAFGKTPSAYRDEVMKRDSGRKLELPNLAAHPERRMKFS
ncbi:MAG TPA: helix-turn-helix domain-containing protein [Thermoanaerobaculia bacterium]|nr:helix-turn-helix domain-containing protein [Thermoanaerobaculia bacterium]